MDTIGRYAVSSVLGEGGFATVYRTWDSLLQREVALKALFPHLALNAEVRARFIAEARALATLQHANIVRFFDVDETREHPYFTMELIDGPSLADTVQRAGPLPLPDVIGHLRALASALDYLHAAGIVHRDVKPANVMVDRSGRTVLMDFGIARSLDATQHTRTGAVLGTVEYMSPEQVRGLPVGPAADIYALGILTYFLLAGAPPYEGDTAFVLHAHAYEPPPPLSSRAPGLPAVVYHAIDAALAKDPAARPPSATAFVEWLTGVSVPEPPKEQPVGASRRRRLALAGAVAVAAVALAGTAGAALSLRGTDTKARAVATQGTGLGGASVLAVGGAATPETPPEPLALTEFTVYDNIFSLQSGAFVAGGSVVACIKLAQPRAGEQLRFVVLPASLTPAADTEQEAIARRDGVRTADDCTELPLRQDLAKPGEYRAWAIYRNEPISSSRFRLLEPPPPPTPEPSPPPTPSPAPSPTVAATIPWVSTILPTQVLRTPVPTAPPPPPPPTAPPPTQRIPDPPPTATPPRTPSPSPVPTAPPPPPRTPSPTPVRTATPPPPPPPPPPTPRPATITVFVTVSPSSIPVGGEVSVCATVNGYAALRFSVVSPFSQFLGEGATGSSYCLNLRAPSAGVCTIVVDAYESGVKVSSASASFTAR